MRERPITVTFYGKDYQINFEKLTIEPIVEDKYFKLCDKFYLLYEFLRLNNISERIDEKYSDRSLKEFLNNLKQILEDKKIYETKIPTKTNCFLISQSKSLDKLLNNGVFQCSNKNVIGKFLIKYVKKDDVIISYKKKAIQAISVVTDDPKANKNDSETIDVTVNCHKFEVSLNLTDLYKAQERNPENYKKPFLKNGALKRNDAFIYLIDGDLLELFLKIFNEKDPLIGSDLSSLYDFIINKASPRGSNINEEHLQNEASSINSVVGEVEKRVFSKNVIYYGVPGCGKSYLIKKEFEKNKINNDRYTRILFHPEYTYSDFVGQIMPVFDEKLSQIKYEFVPGPFTKILKEAYSNPHNNYYLVIEEINRGNAPAIFGDLFQLLDRNKNGESEYPINNDLIKNYLIKEGVELSTSQIYIPKNLIIYATMNTSDQSVFTLDTAFKRRRRMVRVKNDFSKVKYNNDGKLEFKNGREFKWVDFGIALNKDILDNCNDGITPEDKLLGAFFIKENELDVEIFADKVLMYLWNDVVKYDKSQLFYPVYSKELDKTIEAFIRGENIFNDKCLNLAKLYEDNKPKAKEDLNNETETEGSEDTSIE